MGRDHDVEVVPITDPGTPETNQDPTKPPPRFAEIEELELGEAAPASIGEVMPAPSRWPAIKHALDRGLTVMIVLALIACVASLLAFTDLGRDAKKLVERSTREPALYTFTDDSGIVHIVDDLDKVPKAYRKRAKKQ